MTITAHTDAELLARARSGDDTAFTELYMRHQPAAQRLAASFRRLGDPDDLVNTSFERVISAIRRGAGPTESFRAYLFVTLRRNAAELGATAPDASLDDVPEPIVAAADAPALDNADRALITRAFESLPDRWQAVLWHTAVEGRRPRELADSLGVSPNAAAAMAYRAREKLRQAYLQAHLLASPAPEHEPFRSQLGGYVRGGLSARDTAAVEDHLDDCGSCTALLAELEDVNASLSRAVLPLFLLVGGGKLGGALLGAGAAGGVAAGVASGGAETGGAAVVGAAAGGAAGGAGAGGAAAGGVSVAKVGLVARVRHLAPAIGGGTAVVAAAAIALALILADDAPEPADAPAEAEVAAPPEPPPTTTPPTTAPPAPVVPAVAPSPPPAPPPATPPTIPPPTTARPAPVPPTPPPIVPPPTIPPPVAPAPTAPPPTVPPPPPPEPAPVLGINDSTWVPDGAGTGTLTVPVSHPGGGALVGATIVLDTTGGVAFDPDRPSAGCTQDGPGNAPITCAVPMVPAGGSTEVTIFLTVTGNGQKTQSLVLFDADGYEIDRLDQQLDLQPGDPGGPGGSGGSGGGPDGGPGEGPGDGPEP